jgi:hypothetical protein
MVTNNQESLEGSVNVNDEMLNGRLHSEEDGNPCVTNTPPKTAAASE